jgi:hypothetical protein
VKDVPNNETLRLHLGELDSEEILVARAAYRLALAQTCKSPSPADGAEIDLRLDEGALARVDWVAEHSWTDRETVIRVILANHVYAPGDAKAPLLDLDVDEPSDAMMDHIASVVDQGMVADEAIGDQIAGGGVE